MTDTGQKANMGVWTRARKHTIFANHKSTIDTVVGYWNLFHPRGEPVPTLELNTQLMQHTAQIVIPEGGMNRARLREMIEPMLLFADRIGCVCLALPAPADLREVGCGLSVEVIVWEEAGYRWDKIWEAGRSATDTRNPNPYPSAS